MNPTLSPLAHRIRGIRRALDRQSGEAEAVRRARQVAETEIVALTQDIEELTKATLLLTGIGEQRQAAAQHQIELLVTKGLQTIFSDELSFHVIPVVRANRPEVDFVVRSILGTTTIDTPVMDARGGGLAAVVGFLLRLVVLLLSRDRQDSVLFLDETFAHVSAEFEPRLAEFLRELVDQTGVQIILVTHSDAYSDAADKRFRLTLHRGTTQAAEF